MFCPSGHCLCRTLQTQSTQVWNDLQDAEMLGTPYHEDTVTQSLALHLNRQHPADNRVHIFGRAAESKNGSDFIWLFFEPSLSRYFPVAVQAKRLYPSGRYDAFKAHQVDKIRKYAHVIGGVPIYLTYNFPEMVPGLWKVWSHGRPTWPVHILDYQRDLGLSYVHADHVVGIKDGKLSPSDIASHCFPMWTPFCQCRASSSGDPLNDLWLRFSVSAEGEEPSAARQGPMDTHPLLRSWKSGEEVRDEGLMDVLRMYEFADGEGFSPSFVLGTTIGGRDER